MKWLIPQVYCGLLVACILPAVLACGCQRGQTAARSIAADGVERAEQEPDCTATSRDDLVGWYATSNGERLIPVLMRDGAYYSVCRGFEIPFKESPAGLEWALSQSSMTGTTIGIDEESGKYFLAVFDSEASNFTDGRSGGGEKEPLTRIEAPPWIRNPTAAAPGTHDDFLGWFEPIWFPQSRFELRKDGGAYVAAYGVVDTSASATGEVERRVLTPLPEGLGFTGFERGADIVLTYNVALRRFELMYRTASGIRMPLARVPALSEKDVEAALPSVRIGIPAWH